MIYTITCNPALDCTVRLGELHQGVINFVEGCVMTPGGKGINVSRILTEMGIPNVALGFVAGSNGRMLESALQKMGLETAFIHLDEGQTRINVKLYGTEETELNAPGPIVPEEAIGRLLHQLENLHLQPEDVVCLCGSRAPGMDAESYQKIVAHIPCRVAVDTTGPALLGTLSEKPWVIKPNLEELEELVGRKLPTLNDVKNAAGELVEKGARHVLVSMGGDGALLVGDGCPARYQPAPDGQVIGTVGAGDSLLAGFLTGADVMAGLCTGVACGSATAFAEGLATAPEIQAVLGRLEAVKEI